MRFIPANDEIGRKQHPAIEAFDLVGKRDQTIKYRLWRNLIASLEKCAAQRARWESGAKKGLEHFEREDRAQERAFLRHTLTCSTRTHVYTTYTRERIDGRPIIQWITYAADKSKNKQCIHRANENALVNNQFSVSILPVRSVGMDNSYKQYLWYWYA